MLQILTIHGPTIHRANYWHMVSCSMAHSIKFLGMRCSSWSILLRPNWFDVLPPAHASVIRIIQLWWRRYRKEYRITWSPETVRRQRRARPLRRRVCQRSVTAVRRSAWRDWQLLCSRRKKDRQTDRQKERQTDKNAEICYVHLQRWTPAESVDYFSRFTCSALYWQLEIRSVERGICPIATSTINERTVPIIMARYMAHEREGYISTCGLKSNVTLVFLDPDFF